MPARCMRPAFHPGDINRYGFIRNAHRLEKISGGPSATLYFEGPVARESTLAKGTAIACRVNGRRRVTIGCSGDGAAPGAAPRTNSCSWSRHCSPAEVTYSMEHWICTVAFIDFPGSDHDTSPPSRPDGRSVVSVNRTISDEITGEWHQGFWEDVSCLEF